MAIVIFYLLISLILKGYFGAWSFVYIALLILFPFAKERWKFLWYVVSMSLVFTSVKTIDPVLFGANGTADWLLAKIDDFLIGGDPSLWLQSFYHPWLTEIMSFCYMSFIVFLFFSFFFYGIFTPMKTSELFFKGLFLLYSIGLVGYTLVPAQGPFVYFADAYSKNIPGSLFMHLNDLMVASGSAGFDVYPSLHVGISLFLLLFYFRHNRKLFYVFLPFFIGIVFSTMYLRYHYFIDIVSGAIFSTLAFYNAHLKQREQNETLEITKGM